MCLFCGTNIAELTAGYREASTVARDQLEAVTFDHKADEAAFRQDLLNIARTTLSSKILTQARPCHCGLMQSPSSLLGRVAP